MKGKVAVITGGAKGIGKAIAQKFAEAGAYTVILDFDQVNGEQSAAEFSQSFSESLFIQTDVSNPESLQRASEQVFEHFHQVDILVINAGISYLHSIDVLHINLDGSFYTLKAFYDYFVDDVGKVIFITSGSAITGTGGGMHYASSKAGQHGFMRAASKELGPRGINVNAIAPRVIQTDILDTLYPDAASREELVKKIPLRRIGQPEDIANLALFLASPESSYIHGQIMLADGGRTY